MKVKTMNSKITTNSQLSTTGPKTNKQTNKNPKQTTRTGTESQKWRSHSPGWCGSVDGVPVFEPKGHWFNPQPGHTLGWQARFPVGGV